MSSPINDTEDNNSEDNDNDNENNNNKDKTMSTKIMKKIETSRLVLQNWACHVMSSPI